MMYSVRKSSKKDMDAVASLRIKLLKEVGNIDENCEIPSLKQAIKNYMNQRLNHDFMCWVAEKESKIVGISGFLIVPKPPEGCNLSGLEGYVMNMYTLPEHRGKGVATMLLNTIINYAKSRKIKVIRLNATDSGRPLYERIGFKSPGSEMEYRC